MRRYLTLAAAGNPVFRFGSAPTKAFSAWEPACWDARAQGHVETQFRWIAPCRRRLERDGDYPKATEQAA